MLGRSHRTAAKVSPLLAGALALAGGLGAMAATAPAALADTTCAQAGGTGLTAAIVATSGERVSGLVNAAGCDVGIYVGPGVTGVNVINAYVTGANDHGILVQDTSGFVVTRSVVTGNGVDANAAITEDKGIDLVGTTKSSVIDNLVTNNQADGGIALNDDGPVLDPGAPSIVASTLHVSSGNRVEGNFVSGNLVGCGIVMSSYNPGAGVVDNIVADNHLIDTPGTFPPAVSGIVMAGQYVADNHVVNNTIIGSFQPGIVIHSNYPPEDLTGNVIAHNTLSNDDWGMINALPDNSKSVGITIGAGGVLSNTLLANNWISNEDIGIYQYGNPSGTQITGDNHNTATQPIVGP